MTDTTAPGGAGTFEPTFSLVVPVHDVAEHLPAFLDSLERQTHPMADCEVLFVNAGWTDATATMLRAWAARTGIATVLIDGREPDRWGAANRGLERATGGWVSFPDPADTLDARYLERMDAFLRENSDAVVLVSGRDLILDDEDGEIRDTHPLRARFADGTRIVALDASPDVIPPSARSVFYRRARSEELGLGFDASARSFADASFTARYLIASPEPRIGLVADAHYLHRERDDGRWADRATYTTVLEHGHLALLGDVVRVRGSVPTWVQNLVLYDLLSYFRTDQSARGATGQAPEEWTDRFHELARAIIGHIDTETIDRFAVVPTSRQLKEALVIGYRGERTRPDDVARHAVDADQGLVQVRYFHGAPVSAEELWVDGVRADPVYAKRRDISYLNRVLLHERIMWLPSSAEIVVALDGRRFEVRPEDPSPYRELKSAIRSRVPRVIRTARRLQRALSRDATPSEVGAVTGGPAGVFAGLDPADDARIVREAGSAAVRRRFERAWTFMDRDTQAHDNAEHLYRYVRVHRTDVNAWFVLRRESADWDRLEAEGFRLVAFGTTSHVQLLLNTEHLISSQADRYVVHPLDRARFGTGSWRFTFLQHGITYNDLSRWLNGVPIDRFVTASPAEHEGIVGDGSPYVFTEKEVRLTGFPRHDRLRELRQGVDRPSLMLVMPTWRRWLLGTASGGNARNLNEPLASTGFGRAWFGFLGSTELKAIADAADLEIAFVPHPNLEPFITPDDVPGWVRVHGYQSSDVQELLARAAVTVTDYSSQAFEAAYVECPVVYYQFDRDAFYSGAHAYREGPWDATTHGFGPVVGDLGAAIDAVRDAVRRGPVEPFRTRMRETFAFHDGRCCERTVESILSLTRPAT